MQLKNQFKGVHNERVYLRVNHSDAGGIFCLLFHSHTIKGLIMDNKTITLIQEMLFDVTDLLNGETFKQLGYENKNDFLKELKSKLEQVENNCTL